MYRIERFLEDTKTAYDDDQLELSVTRIDLSLQKDEVATGEIIWQSKQEKEVQCIFYSGHYRMLCLENEMSAAKGALHYKFDAHGLDEGSTIKSEICILSNAGEYRIPFEVKICEQADEQKEEDFAKIRNLFHFANLAHTDFDEAVRLFYQPEFKNVFAGHEHQYYGIYKGLLGMSNHQKSVDEFLIAIHKKSACQVSLKEDTLILQDVSGLSNQYVSLMKDGWGYLDVKVSATASFLQVTKEHLTQDDFIDQVCEYCFIVDEKKLRNGYNVGNLIFRFGDREISCKIVVNLEAASDRRTMLRRNYKKLIDELMNQYLIYSASDGIDEQTLREAEKVVEKINSGYGKNISGRFYQAHVLLLQKRFSEARWILSRVENMLDDKSVRDTEYAYYLFLCAVLDQAENVTGRAYAELKKLVEKNPIPKMVVLYLALAPEEEMDTWDKFAAYEKLYSEGYNSPILYRQAFRVVEENTACLNKLKDFETSLILFAIRRGLFTQSSARQLNYLAQKEKDVSNKLLYALYQSYHLFELEETLQAICTILIRMDKRDRESHKYYELAVKKEMRITSLYEYFFLSMDESEPLLPPQSVLMYFSYDCNLPDQRKAYLYRLILENKKDLRNIADKYQSQIESFVWQQLSKEAMNENMAYLYKATIKDAAALELAKDKLDFLVFAHCIQVADAKARKVVVISDHVKKERVYPIEHQKAYVWCYTPDYTILLEDENGNRYFEEQKITDTKVFQSGHYVLPMEDLQNAQVGLLLHEIYIKGDDLMSDPDLWPIYEALAFSTEVEDDFKIRIMSRLMEIYDEQQMYDKLYQMLENFPLKQSNQKQRAMFIRYYMNMGNEDKVFEYLFEYGFEEVSAKIITRFLTGRLDLEAGCDSKLLVLCYETFKSGKYTAEMLAYLSKYFEGSVKQMRDVWLACLGMEVDVTQIAEKIIQANLFARGYVSQLEEIFESYIKSSYRPNIVNRFVQRMAYNYFVKQELCKDIVFNQIERALSMNTDFEKTTVISYLYYMSQEKKEFSDEQKKLITRLVMQVITEDGFLPFFRKFKSFIPALSIYAGKTYLEYRSLPGKEVVLNYLLDDKDLYLKKKMKEICDGYYVESFLMMFSQRMEYYFVETDTQGDNTSLTQSGFLEKSDMPSENDATRYDMLNDVMMSLALGEKKDAEELLEQYIKQSALHDALGELMK